MTATDERADHLRLAETAERLCRVLEECINGEPADTELVAGTIEDEWERELYTDGDTLGLLDTWALEIRLGGEWGFGESTPELNYVRMVWGTGGPHYETTLRYSGAAEHTAYGWFGSDKVTLSGRHEALAGYLFELADDIGGRA